MAKRKINRSQAIRDYMTTNPSAGPSAIIEGLGKKGIKVSAALVSAVKYHKPAGGGNGRKKKGRRLGSTSSHGRKVEFAQLVEAKHLADKMGGVEKAKSALDMLAKLMT